jgi:hypothetical protein
MRVMPMYGGTDALSMRILISRVVPAVSLTLYLNMAMLGTSSIPLSLTTRRLSFLRPHRCSRQRFPASWLRSARTTTLAWPYHLSQLYSQLPVYMYLLEALFTPISTQLGRARTHNGVRRRDILLLASEGMLAIFVIDKSTDRVTYFSSSSLDCNI